MSHRIATPNVELMSAIGRGCVKTQNSKSQVGITLYISWFQSLVWGFYTQISRWMAQLLSAVPKTTIAK
jgi:hypothetical protein